MGLNDVAEAPSDRLLPTGEQYTISGQTADGFAVVTIAQLAASLRAFTVDGVDVVQRYPLDASPSLGAGIVMVPWPNRIRDGRWELDGTVQQLDITEAKFTNAIHGLLVHTPYTLTARTESSVTLSARILTAPGYPFVLDTAVTYAIGDGGLSVTHTITNRGGATAPVAVGTHGYFMVGGVDTGELVLTNSAETIYTGDDRYLPTGRTEVAGAFDLRGGRRVSEVALDDCFTGQRLTDGEHRTRLTAPDGRFVEVWTDHTFGHVVLLTTSEFVGEDGTKTLAVAIEPQTAAADCLNNGDGLRWIDPAESFVARWGVRTAL